jgi:cell division protein FtsI (penicillin-binding protein 3)
VKPNRLPPTVRPTRLAGGTATRVSPGGGKTVGKAKISRLGLARPVKGVTGPEMEARVIADTRTRARVVFGGICLFLTVLALRAAWVMVIPDERLEERGRDQFQAAEDREGQRGAMYDRNGRLLAMTVNLPALYANPSRFMDDDSPPPVPAKGSPIPQKIAKKELDDRIPAIAALVGKSEDWVRTRFAARNAAGNDLQEIRLGGSLDPVKTKEIIGSLPRDVMWVVDEPVRVYPGKEMAAPLLGFTDASGDGAAGLEKVLQKELAGETYRILVAHDRKGRAIDAGVDDTRLARSGHSVRLTLDASIQHATEIALDHVMVSSQPSTAMAVVMDIHTGAILAMASRPTGNPNDGGSRAHQELFKNYPAMDQIEPGSVMKPFIAAAALEEGLVTPDTMLDCELGHWTVGGRTIRDDHPKGVISVTEVIKYSSNIGAAKLGFKLGAERVFNYLKDFGFGRTTGLALPGEVAGSMRSAATVKEIELATTSFGQGITASPVQLAAAISSIANGGIRNYPYLVDAVLDREGEVEARIEPRVDRRIISEETARTITRMMKTVTEEGGTGTRARVDGYAVAGKTGTAQKVENGVYSATKRVSSFVGFLPASHPEVAIAVVVDTPTVGSKYGGLVAAPVFSEIGNFTMRYLGVPRDPPSELVEEPSADDEHEHEPAPPPPPKKEKAPPPPPEAPPTLEVASDGNGGWILPDLRGRSMRDALAGLESTGVALDFDGYGRVTEQSPAPGAHVAAGDAVHLRFN